MLLGFPAVSLGADKSGVTPGTISLPSGPGSIEGLGESFEPTLNTGTAGYGLSLTVPPGTAGHAPNVGLSYVGGRGNGPLGFGWLLDVAFVQRQTDKGIPRYIDDDNGIDDDLDGEIDEPDERDRFVNESGEELVLTQTGYFFCENEGTFIRYQFVRDATDGDYWTATLPNGTHLEFGRTTLARITDGETGRTFKWLLSQSTDTNGNTIVYRYATFSAPADPAPSHNINQRYLSVIEYGPGGPPWTSFHFIAFVYETRPDWFEDARPGFLVRTGMRLREIVVGTQGPVLDDHASGDFNRDGTTDYLNRKYLLSYRAHAHWSLVASVTQVGGDGQSMLPPMQLEYTVAELPDTLSAAGAILGSQNTPLRVMDNDLVDLVDLNGDALPDILKTQAFGGPHTAYLNQGEKNSAITWSSGREIGGDPMAGNFDLGSTSGAVAHLTDIDGDGLADFVYSDATDQVSYFRNGGDVTWGNREPMNVASGAAPPSPFRGPAGNGDVKTADIDFDKRMDIIQSIDVGFGADYRIWLNRGGNRFARSTTVSQDTGFMFSQSGVHIADLNGDRVPDIVRVRPTRVEVTAGLGYGRFAPLESMFLPDYTLSDTQVVRARLEDVTGDGLADLVLERATPGQLWYWINLGNYTFDHRRMITGMPTQFGTDPEIRWADMNGNGTTDLVYADRFSDPRLQTIDIGRLIGCSPSPNLLTGIHNGIGRKTSIEYATSTRYALDDAGKERLWPSLPFPVDVISRVIVDDSMGHQYVTEYTYHDGYYDPDEKEFRGFGAVEQREVGDPTAPDLILAYRFDTGAVVEALKGKTLEVAAQTHDGEVFYREQISWSTRVLHPGVEGDPRNVTFPFQSNRMRDVLERGNGTPVQLFWEYEHDDFGNRKQLLEHGRTDAGWNDERKTVISYTASHPSGRAAWILRGVCEQTISDPGDGTQIANQRTYYDGRPDLCDVSRGNATRTESWVSGSDYVINTQDYDTYGNVVAIYDPLHGSHPGHFRQLVYDTRFHTYPEQEIIHTGNPAIPTLRFAATYDAGLEVMKSSIDPNQFTTLYGHDTFARLTSITKPPDLDHTVEYDYVIAHDLGGGQLVNWVETRQRDDSSGDGFLHARTFLDGLGRTLMTRSEGEGRVIVTDVTRFNARKSPWRQYLPYAEAGSLDYAIPAYTGDYTEHHYDALGRETRLIQPDGSFATTEYAPLSRTAYDEEQNNPDSSHYGSGSRFVHDGLLDEEGSGRLLEVTEIVKISDLGEPLGTPAEWLTRYEYDLLDNLTKITDSQGNEKRFDYDALSRKLFMDDPNRGVMTWQYDAASNLVETLDAKGQAIDYRYDGINRLLSENYLDQGGGPLTDPVDVTYHYDLPLGPVGLGDGSVDSPANTRGFLTSVFDLSGEEHTSYDERGRVAWVAKRIADPRAGVPVSYTTWMSQDSMDRLTSLTYPDNDRVTYAYNARGLLEAIHGGSSGSILSNLDYTPSSQQDLAAYGNGVTTDYTYDTRLRLRQLTTTKSPASHLLSYEYGFDAASNILQIDDLRPTSGALSTGTPRRNGQSFRYDDLYRLTGVDYAFDVGDSPASIAYRYDRIGNMLSKTSNIEHEEDGRSVTHLGAMHYGEAVTLPDCEGRPPGTPAGPHALTRTGNGPSERLFAYDANGNMTCLDEKKLHWDFKDRLVAVENDSMRAEYTYDYSDRRVIKQVTAKPTPAHAAPPSPQVTLYVNRNFEVRANEQPVKYVWQGAIRVARITGSLDASRERIQRFQLFEGWNLITLAIQAGDAAAQLGIGNNPALTDTFQWNPASQGYDVLTADSPLPAGSVVWVRASAPTMLQVLGTFSEPTTSPISADGNFVSIPGFQALNLDQSLPPETEQAWVFDAENQIWRGRFTGDLDFLSNAPDAVSPGDVIYVRASGPSQLTVPDAAAQIRYYHQDHLGSSNVVADGDGALVEEVVFYPFGHPRNELRPSATTRVEPYKFGQKELDNETGNQYFEARYLTGSLGRFLNVDPVVFSESTSGNVQEMNAYAYARNSPVNRSDASGLQSEDGPHVLKEVGESGFNLTLNIASETFKSVKEIGQLNSLLGLVEVKEAYNKLYSTPLDAHWATKVERGINFAGTTVGNAVSLGSPKLAKINPLSHGIVAGTHILRTSAMALGYISETIKESISKDAALRGLTQEFKMRHKDLYSQMRAGDMTARRTYLEKFYRAVDIASQNDWAGPPNREEMW